MTADQRYSAGARYERQALRTKLERMRKADATDVTVKNLLQWVRSRESRYNKKPGGL